MSKRLAEKCKREDLQKAKRQVVDYSDWSSAALKAEAKKRNVPAGGRKQDVIARLKLDDLGAQHKTTQQVEKFDCGCEVTGSSSAACDVCGSMCCLNCEAPERLAYCASCGERNSNQYCADCMSKHDCEDFLN